MRAVSTGVLVGVIVLGTVGLSAASSIGAASDGLSSDSILADFRVEQAFSGRAQRVPDDPDAPIQTGRWAENNPEVALAGGPSVTLAGGPSPVPSAAAPAPQPVQVASLASTIPIAARVIPPPPTAAVAPPATPRSMAALQPVRQTQAASRPRVSFSASLARDGLAPGAGLDPEDRFTGDAFAMPRISRPSPVQEVRRLLMRVGPSQDASGKGRWFVFVAASGDALGLNLGRDPEKGLRGRWSVERLAEFGKAQLGVGWRKGRQQIALSAARREIGAYGVSREDTVVGVNITYSGQRPSKPEFKPGIRRQ